MRHSIAGTVAGLSLVAGSLFAASTAQARHVDPVLAAMCTATAEGELRVKEGEQEIKVTLSEALADSATATFAPNSNLKASRVAKDVEPNVMKLFVDASKAAPGAYAVTLTAGEKSCTGEVKVAAAAAPTVPTTP